MVNGEEYTAGNPTTTLAAGSKVTKLPTAPASPCSESNQFVGWSEDAILTPQNEVPADLFSDAEDAPTVSHDVIYNAVFAHLTETESSAPKTLIFAKGQESGWTISETSYTNSYWPLTTDAYIESPVVDLSKLQSITLNVRTYNGTEYNIIDISCNGQNLGTVDAVDKKLKDKTWEPSTTLSGGESQRVKLATELARPGTGKTLYILDEPTTGLHFEDVRVLMGVLRRLVDKGNTVIIIEHHPDVIRSCDYLIDMGPEGGRDGGMVVATGTLDDIRQNPKSITGRYV
jgi:hypothetical protein